MAAGLLAVIFFLVLLGLLGGFVAEMMGFTFVVGFSIGVAFGVVIFALLGLEA